MCGRHRIEPRDASIPVGLGKMLSMRVNDRDARGVRPVRTSINSEKTRRTTEGFQQKGRQARCILKNHVGCFLSRKPIAGQSEGCKTQRQHFDCTSGPGAGAVGPGGSACILHVDTYFFFFLNKICPFGCGMWKTQGTTFLT